MQLVTADEFVNLHKEALTSIRENDKLKEENKKLREALKEIAGFDCCDDCYSTAYEVLIEFDEEFQKNISKANEFIEEQKKKLEAEEEE
ncbi:hypothetical protein [Lactococcus lactis]|uniref:hypothetical protein n=1 Tax=Lactococcus lactis TaxID=1358 RepID=UPI001F585F57|nr:hypothetical protein [Lactococcus lactis]